MSFEEFYLSERVAKAIREIGLRAPTPIQQESIPQLLAGRDLIGQAQTGTGKTFAFAIPIVEKINPSEKVVQAIVLTPTRELALQVSKEFEKIGQHKKTYAIPVYGGQPIGKQMIQLRKGVHIVVGTPGRVIDHIRRGTLNLKSVRFAVLDEADRMLDMGFVDDMKFILAQIPKNCQRMMFSATIPTEISWLAKRYMRDPAEVKISKDTPTVPQMSHKFYLVTEFDKFNILCKLIDSGFDGLLLVFRKTKTGVDDLATALSRRGYRVRGLHGDYSQREREKVVKLFRKGQVNILIATDVAARGLDITGISHVLNYDIPQDPESYIHRIGRTGRAGKDGMAITFITHWQYTELKRIQAVSKVKIERASTPIPAKYDRVASL